MRRPAQRRELAVKAVAMKGVSIALACQAFGISETCYRYSPKMDEENEQRWSRNVGPVVKVDRMMKETIQNEETKEPFS